MNGNFSYFIRNLFISKKPELLLDLVTPEEKLKAFQKWVREKDEEISKIQEERKRQDTIEYSEYQVKDFANWCMRAVIDDRDILKKWILNGPEFLFKEWKKSRNL